MKMPELAHPPIVSSALLLLSWQWDPVPFLLHPTQQPWGASQAVTLIKEKGLQRLKPINENTKHVPPMRRFLVSNMKVFPVVGLDGR